MQNVGRPASLVRAGSIYNTGSLLSLWQSLLQWDSLMFGAVCVLDMLSTMYWVHNGTANEGNPWLAYWLHRGMASFAAMKLTSFVPTLFIAAYYRATYPRLVAVALRAALAIYLVVYVFSVAAQLRG